MVIRRVYRCADPVLLKDSAEKAFSDVIVVCLSDTSMGYRFRHPSPHICHSAGITRYRPFDWSMLYPYTIMLLILPSPSTIAEV